MAAALPLLAPVHPRGAPSQPAVILMGGVTSFFLSRLKPRGSWSYTSSGAFFRLDHKYCSICLFLLQVHLQTGFVDLAGVWLAAWCSLPAAH